MENLLKTVEEYRELILECERYIWWHPETGYREVNTSKYMEDNFKALGYKDLFKAGDIPGFYTVVDTGRDGPEVLILAELDSLICPNHKESNAETGYVHACGHNAQCAAMLGIAAALKKPEVISELCGRVRLAVVPAEELIEIEYRQELMKRGVIKYFGGKSEFLHRGYFDGADIAFMVHTAKDFQVCRGSVGCIAKKITYKGRSSHAGGAPQDGINALYAAAQGLNAANALRETFPDDDHIRFHPIVTHGGEAVNAIPEKVTIESYVRGASFEAMIRENKKINRALTGAALSLGANVEIIDSAGYSPLYNDEGMVSLAAEAAAIALPEIEFKIIDKMNTGSTDMGDLSGLMPTIHPYAGGSAGIDHGENYAIADPESACVKSAKWQLAMLILLLQNDGERAKKIITDFKPTFASKDEYFAYVEAIKTCGDRIVYNDDGTATVL